MRLHRLVLGAVGPFATSYDLDLDQVAAGGLFLLEGPTGAGKSTVLDAVTFALYGTMAGRSTSKDRLHTDFATAVEPLVELEFSVGGLRYRVRRTPAHERPKRSGTGVTSVPAAVRLWRLEPGLEVLVSNRVREADDEIRRLLGGLSCEQFRQVVVLPQGEFATFLRADPDERREVLQRLFSTEHYQAVERVLVDLRKDAAQRIGHAEDLVRDALAALKQASGGEHFDVAELLEQSDDARRVRLDLLEDLLRDAAAVAEAAQRASALRRAESAAAHEAVLERIRRSRALAEASATRARLEADHAVVGALVARRDAAVRAQAVAPLITGVLTAAAELRSAESALALADRRADADRELPLDAPALRGLAAELRAEAGRLDPLVERESALSDRLVEIADCDTALSALVGERILVASRVAELPTLVIGHRSALERARQLATGHAALSARLADARARLEAAQALPDAERALAVHEESARSAIDAHHAAVEAYQQAVAARLRGMAGELAAGLHDGEACVVCGALEHPAPAVRTADAVEPAALRGLEDAARDAAERRATAQDALARARGSRDELRLRAGEADPEAEIAVLTEAAASAASAETLMPALERDLVELESALESERARLSEVETDIARTETRSHALARARDADAELLERARGEHIGVRERQQSLLARAESLDSAATAADSVRAADELHTQALRLADDAARGAGFTDLLEAGAAVLDDVTTAELTARIDSHLEAWAVSEATLADPAVAGAEREAPDPAPTGLALADAELAHEDARTSAELARTRVRHVHACREQLAAAEAATADVRESTRPVVRVADAVTGQGSVNPRRITLSTYVLRERFDSVVAAASRRLEKMSSGRFALERDEARSGGKKAGLGLAVLDQWTGTRRDTTTLSGGESFYASLSLALGLADVVRDEVGGVELETLFIDEGFGTLDSDTLESVLDVIDSLRDGGRIVGIVSHVHELKERIPDRIEVRRLADGSSSVAVRA